MNKDPYEISTICSRRLVFPFYFLSDIHLSTCSDMEQDKRLKYVLDLLQEVHESRGTLFILGDFFDFWFDKNAYIPEILRPVVELMSTLVHDGIEIHYIAGNHDYWIKGYLTNNVGIRFYPNALAFEFKGERFFMHHGDGVILENRLSYIARKIMRSWWAIGLLKLLPIKWIYKLGEKVSHYNRKHDEIPSTPLKYVEQMKEYLSLKIAREYNYAISGHVHAPFISDDNGKKAVILGDWIHHWTYAYMDDDGFELRKVH